MKTASFWLLIFATFGLIYSMPENHVWLDLLLRALTFVIAINVYEKVNHQNEEVEEKTEYLNFKLEVFLLDTEEELLWEYIDNVVPQTGHKIVYKKGNRVEHYKIITVFQNVTRNVEIYVEPC